MLFRFNNRITEFYFASFRFWSNYEKLLSQMNFSMKFGSKKENMNRFTLLKKKTLNKLYRFKMVAKTFLNK